MAYCESFDSADWQTFAGLWAENARWHVGEPFGTFEGGTAITAAAREMRKASWISCQHQMTGFAIIEKKGHTVRSEVSVTCTGTTADGRLLEIRLLYHDRYVRSDEGWKIAERRNEVKGVVPLHYPFPQAPALCHPGP